MAYFLLVHKNPEQVSRLIGRLYSPSDYFYIHKDLGKPMSGWEIIPQKYSGGNLILTSKYRIGGAHVGRGGYLGSYAVVQATLAGMNWFRSYDYDHFIFLSGQCYPLKPLTKIKQELGKKNVAYMEYFKLPSKVWEGENWGLDRINYYYITIGSVNIRLPRLNKTLPNNLEPYGGSLYFCLPKRFVDYALDYIADHPEIMRFYRYSKIPDEGFFQTIIMNSPLRSDVVNDHKRYFHWDGTHPSTLRKKDFKELVESDKWFAKRFDVDVDKDILDLLDRYQPDRSTS
jgi:hypothetical protein